MFSIIRNLASRFRRLRAEAESLATLRSLDGHLLDDVGLRRDEIPLIAAGMSPRSHAQRLIDHSGRPISVSGTRPAESFIRDPNHGSP
jgi:uncharacterized protein YjiS (DUF1127 family)